MPRARGQHSEAALRASPCERSVDDWEDWEDDDQITPIEPEEQVLVDQPASSLSSARHSKNTFLRTSRPPSTRIKHLKSRHRQKAQNAKAGIKLITDMAALGRQNHNPTHLRTPAGRPVKFVDAAALRALEGDPNSASVGNWNWFKKGKGKSPASATPQSSSACSPPHELTPGDCPIMIGITLSSEETRGRDMASQHAPSGAAESSCNLALDNALTPRGLHTTDMSPRTAPEPQVSMWSPDTPDTASSKNSRATSSVYSQATNGTIVQQPVEGEIPPVPTLPANYKKGPHQRLMSLECGGNNGDSDDDGTPCTLFEEDGSPGSERQMRATRTWLSPDSAGSRSHGWWDHVVTPFMDRRFTFTSRRAKVDSPRESPRDQRQSPAETECNEKRPFATPLPVPHATPPPIVRAPTPRRTPSPPSTRDHHVGTVAKTSSQRAGAETSSLEAPEKPQIVITPEVPKETPPPYSPPRNPNGFGNLVRYRAVFPPGHPLQSQFPPSPGPVSPGLAATMTSQGATAMSDIPITPTVPRDMPEPPRVPLPDRPLGTSLPQERTHDMSGPENRVERERRRHEKEDVFARRLGGFWRGRGCIPATGCFGRTGREGRKRRRIWAGAAAGLLILIILATVLGVLLTHHEGSHEIDSIWVNLTDFPPMPTGVLTVVGSDNTAAVSGCTSPKTLWSCSLPKEEHEDVAPYNANQPTFIMQIQWDNNTDQWNVANGDPPTPVIRRAVGNAAHAGNLVRELRANKLHPSPDPPDFQEMWFLGNTTDDIQSDEKAGEPAPFYISLLDSPDDALDNPTLSERQTTIGDEEVRDLVPAPDLLADGTPAPAKMIPRPVQQPVRLYDRGLPTEHYGFYTYFKRTIYLKSVNRTDEGDVPLDENGGCTKTEANYLVTWSDTRMLVQIWTKSLGDGEAKLLGSDSNGSTDGSMNMTRPGTMPWPVTVKLDTHGGDLDDKFVWYWHIDERQKLDTENPKLLPNDIGFGGKVINHRKNNNTSFGGFDGGIGGCRCEWVNFT